MRARVLRQFLDGRRVVEEGDDIEVDEIRARELERNRLIVITDGRRNVRQRFNEAPPWWPDWRGETCVIAASGPSAHESLPLLARGRCRVLAVNNSWQLAPWADAVYANDFAWWERNEGLPAFPGLKIGQGDHLVDRPGWGVQRVTVHQAQDRLLISEFGEIGFGGNSGFAALNLAVQFGVSRIVLVGFDMRVDRGLHWHGPHPRGFNNPSAESARRWRLVIDDAAPVLAALGIDVVNASQVSALRAYRKCSLDEVFDEREHDDP